MSNNLIARLRNVQFWQADCDVRMQAAARIEELEDNLQLLCKECHDRKTKDERDAAKQNKSSKRDL